MYESLDKQENKTNLVCYIDDQPPVYKFTHLSDQEIVDKSFKKRFFKAIKHKHTIEVFWYDQ